MLLSFIGFRIFSLSHVTLFHWLSHFQSISCYFLSLAFAFSVCLAIFVSRNLSYEVNRKRSTSSGFSFFLLRYQIKSCLCKTIKEFTQKSKKMIKLDLMVNLKYFSFVIRIYLKKLVKDLGHFAYQMHLHVLKLQKLNICIRQIS